MLHAKNLMRTEVPFLKYDLSTAELFKHSLQPLGFWVVGEGSRVHGMVTEASLLKIFLKNQLHPERQSLILFREAFEPVQFIQEEEPIGEVLKKVLVAIGNRVLVLNNKQVVTGFITIQDLLPHFLGERKSETFHVKSDWESDLYFYENFFDKAPFMMHSVNAEGSIQMANEMLHSVLGYSYPELVGMHFLQLYTPDNWNKAQKGVEVIFKSGFHQVVKSCMLTKNKQKIEVELASRALHNTKGQPIGTVTVSRPLDMQVLIQTLRQVHQEW